MPAPVWTINGTTLAAAGLRLASGSFRAQGVSVMRLERAAAFDATELLEFGASAVLARDGAPFFQGKIISIPKAGSAADENQNYDIADACEDLENTVYQEEWALGASAYLFPRFVFGIGPNALATAYERISVGQMIRNVIAYAISVGVDITAGSIPEGEIPIPSEMENMSCAEVIRVALKLHPDWVPWLDHSVEPPVLNVTPIASLSPVSIALDGSEAATDFQCLKRDDLLPDSVRIVYEFATVLEDGDGEPQIYRDADIDKFPTDGPDGGPRVIGASIPLAGLQMQIQKSRIQARTIPTSAGHADAKSFLIANYPHLALVDPAAFTVDSLTRELIADASTHADPINPRAVRIAVADVDDLPRQLVKGNIEDWMRRKIGRVKITPRISAAAGATAEQKAAIEKGTPAFIVVATNARTKMYKGISQWVAPEDIPTGIAQSVYEAIHAACNYQGNVTLVTEDVGDVRYHGRSLNLTGGVAGWATMNAPVHSVDFDIGSGTTSIGFGPPPYLAPQDFLEMQRILRFRPTRWWSPEERESNKHGGEEKPSAAGDTVNGYDFPEVEFEPAEGWAPPPFSLRGIRIDGADFYVKIHPGWIREIVTSGATGSDGSIFHAPKLDGVALDEDPTPEFAMELDDYLYVTYSTDKAGNVKADPVPGFLVTADATLGKTEHYQPVDGESAGGSDGTYKIRVGQLIGTDATDVEWKPYQNSDIEHYHELFTGKNMGSGASVYKGREAPDDVYEFRRINGNYGILTTEVGDQVDVDFAANNVGGGEEVLVVDPLDLLPDGAAEFRTLRGLTSTEAGAESISPQIQVDTADGDGEDPGTLKSIRIRGNGVVGENDAVVVQDGLVTEVKEMTGGMHHLNLKIHNWIEDTGTGVISAGDPSYTVLYWRDGDFVGDVDPADAPAGLIEADVSNIVPGG